MGTQYITVQRAVKHSHHLGKCDSVIEVTMPSEMKEDVIALGRLMEPKKSASEVMREIASIALYGRLAVIQHSIAP